jgi:NADPH:quinone reductase
MPAAVQFSEYGDVDVLEVVDVPVPEPAHDEVVVAVKAAGTNPGEIAIRSGAMQQQFPGSFPSGQGSDLAGVVSAVGEAVTSFAVGDEVLGYSDRRSSQAATVVVPASHLTPKPAGLSWEVAGSLYVVGVTAWVAVHAVKAGAGDVVAVSAAAGGVGSLAVQLLRIVGAEVLGIASESNQAWLESKGVVPIAYGDGLADRLRAAAPRGIDAFIDTHGPEYVELAVELGVEPDRVDTIIAFEAAERLGAKAEGSQSASDPTQVLAEVAALAADGRLEVPVAATYPLRDVRDAYRELERRHTHGKIVLVP